MKCIQWCEDFGFTYSCCRHSLDADCGHLGRRAALLSFVQKSDALRQEGTEGGEH